MRGASINTGNALRNLATCPILAEYTLIGGTALSLSIGHRLSEDLDFCTWDKSPEPLDLDAILASITVNQSNIKISVLLDSPFQKDINFGGIKVTFFKDRIGEPPTGSQLILGTVRVASVEAIGAMKACVTLSRAKFRDYYDLFSVLAGGYSTVRDIITAANDFKPHLNPRVILQNMMSLSEVPPDDGMNLLKPIYDVTPDEIQTFIRHLSTPSALDLTPSSFENLLSLKRNQKNIEYHTAEPKLEFKNIDLGL